MDVCGETHKANSECGTRAIARVLGALTFSCSEDKLMVELSHWQGIALDFCLAENVQT